MEHGSSVHVVEDSDGTRLQAEFARFIKEYTDASGEKIYLKRTLELSQPERNTLRVDMDHIETHSASLATAIHFQFYRLYPFVCEAVHLITLENCDESIRGTLHKKQLHVAFRNVVQRHKMRELTTAKVGTLLLIGGQVVRTHSVHPELAKGTFECDDCGTLNKDVDQEFRYTQPSKCANPQCANRSRFRLNVDESTFVDFQKVRIQETQAELPRGAIPRSLDVIVRGEMVETVQPGDRCHLIGTLIAIPDVSQLATPGIRAESSSNSGKPKDAGQGLTGLKALGVRDLNYRLAFLATHISSANATLGGKDFSHEDIDHVELWRQMTSGEQQKLKAMSSDPRIAENLIHSLFPNIYGNHEVKLGVLLMLFGGVSKRSKTEGTTLRGDINVCLVGDPSTAKSQVLKTVEEFCPRAIYTSGKASSAAGLTAAVVRDEESFEFVIEAGALMLADRGVCCIDEFDKMAVHDQVAIHEAMEQQTISITKAGVKATLNARASILAAANPIGGRYDRSRPLKQNIALTAPIISRFDLFFVLLDECNEVLDHAIAKRILENHRAVVDCAAAETKYSSSDIQKYITFAKCFRPKLSGEAATTLIQSYKKLRLSDSSNSFSSSWRITVRQLESLVRLSEALARLHCCSHVTAEHVNHATRLLSKSIIRLEQPDVNLDEEDDVLAGDSDEEKENNSAQDKEPSKVSIKFELYKKLSEVFIRHVRADEEKRGEDFDGLRCSAIVDWYLEMMEAELESEEAAMEQKMICEKVISRLISQDNILLRLDDSADPLLVVHPDYTLPDDE